MATLFQDTLVDASARTPRRTLAGRVLSGIAIAFLAMDAGGKLIAPQLMIDNSPALGIPADIGLYRIIGGICAICTLLYALPRTAILGAILLTGFLGGAVAVNIRAEMPLFSNILFGVYVGAMVWGGLILRRPEVAHMLGLSGQNPHRR